jgi:hypothetical protein
LYAADAQAVRLVAGGLSKNGIRTHAGCFALSTAVRRGRREGEQAGVPFGIAPTTQATTLRALPCGAEVAAFMLWPAVHIAVVVIMPEMPCAVRVNLLEASPAADNLMRYAIRPSCA